MCFYFDFDVFISMEKLTTREIYLEKNKKIIAKKKRAYYLANKEKTKKDQKTWRKNNKTKIQGYQKEKMSSDIIYKLKINTKNLIGNAIRNGKFKKLSKTEQILGCTYEDFKNYLENKFELWMDWNNRGLYNGQPKFGWDIDHIIPLSSATCEVDIITLNHYSNLQPLCSYTNRYLKRNKIV